MQLRLDGAFKRVHQLAGGRQSTELKALALRIFDLVSGPAASGTSVESLDDALGKLAEGQLALEVLEVRLTRRTKAGFGGEGVTG